MDMGDVKLMGLKQSPFTNRVQIALNIKSVEHEFIHEPPYLKSELLLKYNPVHKKIPVLIHNEKPISESLVIVEYIDEIWTSAPSILPTDPYDRAVARFWAAYIDDKIISSMWGLRTAKDEEDKLKLQNQIVDGLVLLEGTFIKCSKGQGFFGGDKIGYLDLALGCYLTWIKARQKLSDITLWDELKTPNLVKWGERFCANDAVKDVMPGVEEFIKVITLINKMTQAQSTK